MPTVKATVGRQHMGIQTLAQGCASGATCGCTGQHTQCDCRCQCCCAQARIRETVHVRMRDLQRFDPPADPPCHGTQQSTDAPRRVMANKLPTLTAWTDRRSRLCTISVSPSVLCIVERVGVKFRFAVIPERGRLAHGIASTAAPATGFDDGQRQRPTGSALRTWLM